MKSYWIKRGIFGAIAVVAGSFLFGYVMMHLWNWLIPSLFNGPVIEFWQAIGLFVLSKMLFGGFGFGRGKCGWGCHGSGCGWRGKRCGRKWENMSEEDREKVKRWCGHSWEEKEVKEEK